MATDQRTITAYVSASAAFRTWAQAIEAQLLAGGLLQTTDTGQVDLTAVAKPSASVFAGFRMYRFADALQATSPVFIRVDYGCATVANTPALRITVGTTTDGAGVIGGQMMAAPEVIAPSAAKASGATLPSYCSGAPGRIALVTNVDSAARTFAYGFWVERVRAADGSSSTDGIAVVVISPNSGVGFVVIPPAPAAVPGTSYTAPWPTLDPSGSGHSAKSGANVGLMPCIFIANAIPHLASFCLFREGDIGAGASFTMAHLSATRTFMPFGTALAGSSQMNSSGMAMLWE